MENADVTASHFIIYTPIAESVVEYTVRCGVDIVSE